MCGIFGLLSGIDKQTNAFTQDTAKVVIEGLTELLYRGSDSCGIGYADQGKLHIVKTVGKPAVLGELLEKNPLPINPQAVVAHSRWSTHGAPTQPNAHPHHDFTGRFVQVHNGIIENNKELIEALDPSRKLYGSADSEVLINYIAQLYDQLPTSMSVHDRMVSVLCDLPKTVSGTWALGIINVELPNTIYCVRMSSPLVLGIQEDGTVYFSSDILAFIKRTTDVIYMEDNQVAVINTDSIPVIYDGLTHEIVDPSRVKLNVSIEEAQKQGCSTWLESEIHQQPRVLRDCINYMVHHHTKTGRHFVDIPELADAPVPSRVFLIGSGSSLIAAQWGAEIIRKHAHIDCQAVLASEFRPSYRHFPGTIVIAVTQSGESIDVINAVKNSREYVDYSVALTNMVASTISREVDFIVPLHCQVEKAIPTSKAFTASLLSLYLLALQWAESKRLIARNELNETLIRISKLPELIESQISSLTEQAKKIATDPRFANSTAWFYIARGEYECIAKEAALKHLECTERFAIAIHSAEMKHGFLCSVNPNAPTVALLPSNEDFGKTRSNIYEIECREGAIICITDKEGSEKLPNVAGMMVYESIDADLDAIPMTVAVQLLALESGLQLGMDVDAPRNLAKSVTV